MSARVLVVDDEPDILLALSLNLELAGFEVAEASTGEEALEALRREMPDLLLLDIRLPGIDGWEVVRRVRSDRELRDLDILVLSAHASPGVVDRARELGCRGYVTKPFDIEEVVRTIEGMVGPESAPPGPTPGR